jgi:hypothetical protein
MPAVSEICFQVAPDAIRKDEEERAVEEGRAKAGAPAEIPAVPAAISAGNSGEQQQKLLAKLAEHEETQQKLLQEQKQILEELKQQQEEKKQSEKQKQLEDEVKVSTLTLRYFIIQGNSKHPFTDQAMHFQGSVFV